MFHARPCTKCTCFQCTNDLILHCISAVAMCWIYLLTIIRIPLNVVWYLVYNEYTEHGTTQVTENQRIIFYHALQVYCSPSLKEHLCNPVMALLACTVERTGSILRAHGGVCGVVCVNIHARLCVTCAWCMVVCTCALVCAIVSAPSEWWIQVYKCMYA